MLALNETLAPKTVANFLSYVDRKFYDNTIFHRVIAGSMIQGGGYTADLKEKAADKPIVNEWTNGLKNTRGSVAMARKAGEPDSAAAQAYKKVAGAIAARLSTINMEKGENLETFSLAWKR